MANNATDTNSNCKNETLRKVVNSIDLIPAVDRLPIAPSRAEGVFLYGADNLTPQKYIETVKRSSSAVSATDTYAEFLLGEGFGESVDNIIINQQKDLTLAQVNRNCREQRSFIGFALHLAYNRFGQITDITPLKYEYVRKKIREQNDEWDMYRVKNNWEHAYSYFSKNYSKDFFAYNPTEAKAQIKKVGFENYQGQIYYFKGASTDIYVSGKADAAFDDMQLEAEAKLYSLSSVQNGFSMGGIMGYPANMLDSHANEKFEARFKSKAKGSVNAGSLWLLPIPPNSDLKTMFVPTTMPSIDALFTNQKKEAKDNIFEVFSQPKTLSGRSKDGVFNPEDVENDTNFYNMKTRQDRKDIDKAFNDILSYSIYNISKLETIEKTFEHGRTDINND